MSTDRPFTPIAPGTEEPLTVPGPEPVHLRLPPREWLRKHLFNNWYNSLLTVVLLVLVAWMGWGAFRFIFVTGRWDPVRSNLTLFNLGTYPREEQWRVIVQILTWSGAVGLGWGAAVTGAKHRATQAGLAYEVDPALARVKRYSGLILLGVVFLLFTQSFGPLILTIIALAVSAAMYYLASLVAGHNVGLLWAAVAFLLVFGFQIVSGFFGFGWIWLGAPVAAAVHSLVGRNEKVEPRRLRWMQLGSAGAVLVVLFAVYAIVGSPGVGWDDWEGFHLNLLAAAIAIALSFPLGLLLALGRRSSLPALRVISTVYIEMIRGVPMISLLLMAQFFIGFFLDTRTPLSLFTRATVAMTLFTAAYVAEIVRGGLQAVPRGQVEAGNSVGLAPWSVTRLIVLPQALRAVIPAMVGQFISLFKDTSLLLIIGKVEILGAREIVHGQEAFRGFGIAETLVFAAFAFWAVSFTMSRESQRLERRLGVGER